MAEAAEAFGLDQGGGGLPAPAAERAPTQLASMAPPANSNQPSPLALPPEADQLVKVIRTHEGTAKGEGNVLYGGQSFTPGAEHPADSGWQGGHGPDGRETHAAGPGQWQPGTWHAEADRIKKLGVEPNFADEHQQNWAMWDLGSRTYQARTGRNLAEDIKSGKADYHALGSVWQGLQSGVGPHLVNGPLNQPAMTLVDQWKADLDRKDKQYDSALDEAKNLRAGARAMTEKWAAESDKPPQDMHQAWSQWGGVAGAIALIGGMFGRNHTAALNAAGEMMQAANSADQRAYDKSYQLWKDHLDRGMKLVELLTKDASEIVNNAQKSYDHKIAELGVLSNAYSLQQQLDPNSVARLTQNAQLQKLQTDIIKANNETTEVRLAASDKDAVWLKDHHEANGKVPPSVHNSNLGEAERERSGTGNNAKLAQQLSVAAPLEAKYIAEGMDKAEAHARAYREAGIVSAAGVPKGPEAEVERETKRLNDVWDSDPKNANATAAEKAEAHHKNELSARTEMALATARSPTGKLSDESIKLLAKQYAMGDPGVITSLPRGGPARIQLENQIAKDMENIPDAARQITMNRMRMAEARSAATTAGRVTMNTEVYSTEAIGAGHQVVETSKLFPRTEYPTINAAIAAFDQGTGDPNVVKFGAALNSFVNVYGKMSNPTGTGIHDADKDRIVKILDRALSQGQIEAGIEQIIKEGRIVSSAAQEAQEAVLGRVVPQAPVGQTLAPQVAPQSGRSVDAPPVPEAKKAGDGKWYVPDPSRPGKYLEVHP